MTSSLRRVIETLTLPAVREPTTWQDRYKQPRNRSRPYEEVCRLGRKSAMTNSGNLYDGGGSRGLLRGFPK